MLFAALAAASAHCAPAPVVVAKGLPAAFSAKLVERASKNFEAAYRQACKLDDLRKPLIDPSAKDKRLFLSNAADANVASIYLRSGRMILEYQFVAHHGKPQVPSMQQMLEAIYCAAHGATRKEQEESGRCLPD
jgi:hypothetical protein